MVSNLFYNTVHSVNAADYSAEQLDAWAREPNQLTAKREVLLEQLTLVAEIDGDIVGFGSIDKFGYLDLLYVHKDYQRQGIAAALCDELEGGSVRLRLMRPLLQDRSSKSVATLW